MIIMQNSASTVDLNCNDLTLTGREYQIKRLV